MGSAPDTTLGPRVFGADYFSNKFEQYHKDQKMGLGQQLDKQEQTTRPTKILNVGNLAFLFFCLLSYAFLFFYINNNPNK
jgi:hypothetical protein